MVTIDGSYGEGGGQIVRTALALSTLTGRPIHIKNIRSGRKQPGLKAQHLAAITALKEMCDAKTNNVTLGSTELRYVPGKMKPGRYAIDIGTAGSITLLLQAILLPSLVASKNTTFIIKGGTCGKWQAPVEYFQYVFIPFIKRFASVTCEIKRRGYFPEGQGEVVITVKPIAGIPQQYTLSARGKIVHIRGVSHASRGLASAEVAERQAQAAKISLSTLGVPVHIAIVYGHTACAGSGITIAARCNDDQDEFQTIIGADTLGERGVKAEHVGSAVAEMLKKETESCAVVDSFAADQLLPFLALAGGVMKCREISEHAKTNMWVIEQFLDVTFVVKDNVISVKKQSL